MPLNYNRLVNPCFYQRGQMKVLVAIILIHNFALAAQVTTPAARLQTTYQNTHLSKVAIKTAPLASYQFQKLLATGTSASVYQANPIGQPSHLVAIKCIDKGNPEVLFGLHDYEHEIKLLHSMQHDNIVRLECVFESEMAVWMVTEFGGGGSLQPFCFEGHQLPTIVMKRPMVRRVLRSIASALIYLHSAGVVHRDIKPANIVLCELDQVKLIDFGLSTAPATYKVTAKDSSPGSPYYMAPETLNGHEYDHRVDIYGLGVTIWALFEKPFPGTTSWTGLKEFVRMVNVEKGPWGDLRGFEEGAEDVRGIVKGMTAFVAAQRITLQTVLDQLRS